MKFKSSPISTTLLILFFLAAIPLSSVFAAGAVEMQVDRIVKMTIREYNSAMGAKDPTNLLKYYSKNAFRKAGLSVQSGTSELTEYYKSEIDTFDAKFKLKSKYVHGRSAAVILLWDATHRPSGRSIQIEMAAEYVLSASGKIESVTYYYDSAILTQFLDDVSTASK